MSGPSAGGARLEDPQLWLDHLTTAVALREIIALAQQAPGLTDAQLRARLVALARWLR